ncbi:MAG: cyclic pyranopterin monophosphate synthase MoaC [Clostridiales bacterium]|jgi:cyclic pyranopterin phosphate synthase|nr:cyclic pyranopterin monophosphate synthase MoaC [Clostridiales bacterium]
MLTHFNEYGDARMVDVTGKNISDRRAVATATISMKKETIGLIKNKEISKGDVLATATIGGIMGAKKTSGLIPMCHNIFISGVEIKYEILESSVKIFAEVKTSGQTGVEMEALTAVSIAALAIYDMCKAFDKEMIISDIMLIEKTGGKSGHFINSKYNGG